MLGHGRISFETPNVIDPGDSVPATPARSLQKDFENRGFGSRIKITPEEENSRIIFKPNLSRSIKIDYNDNADEEPSDLLMPVNLDPEYGHGESKEETNGSTSPTLEQTRLFAAAMISESERRGNGRAKRLPVRNLFSSRYQRDEKYLRDNLGLDYPPVAMEKWRNDRRRRCRHAIYILLSAVALFAVFGIFMNMHNRPNDFSGRVTSTKEYLIAKEISTEQSLGASNSPQSKAAEWIASRDGERIPVPDATQNDTRFIQRYVAAVLYYTLQGNEWLTQLDFMSDNHECSWNEQIPDENDELFAVGLSCGSKLDIQSILIPSNNLKGSLPDEIRHLKHLKFISLKHNQISGSLPSALGELSLLQYLDLKYNEIEGSIPELISNLSRLQVLGLSGNKMGGSIPHTMGALRLKTLAIDDNAFTGDLGTIRTMGSLQYLYAQNNLFTGNIFHSILMTQLPDLIEVDLSGNQLTGSQIPSHIFTLPLLRLFDASGNQITGTLPTDIPPNQVLEYLSFRGNQIGSSIPDSISNLSELTHLDLEENALTGTLPQSMSSMTNLFYLFLGKNSFTAMNIPGELKELTSLKELSLNNLGLEGDIPTWIAGLSSLHLLDLRENRLTGSLQGIDFSKLQRMKYLMLDSNELTGEIPESLSSMVSLEVLALYHNNLTGTANPVCAGASTKLNWLATDCESITCDCCNHCCTGDNCYNDLTWDELETSSWDHEYARAEYAFNPNIVVDSIQPRGGF